jgi:hypothetical protein
MPRAFALLALGFLLTAAAPPPLTDLTGPFLRMYEGARGLPPAEQVARFKAEIVPLFPGFYSAERVGATQKDYDSRIARTMERFPTIEARFATASTTVARQLAEAQADFARTFPGSGKLPPTYLLHSLGEMDGGTRDIGGQTVLVFGADVIARVHAADANERAFFEHELFHVYHEPVMKGCEAMWCSLWEEGLATYVAASLNPGAKPQELLLDEATMAKLRADPAPAACIIRRVALSTDDGNYKRLFNGGASMPGQPERLGYYIGELVVEQVGQGKTLPQLAAMPVPEARTRVLAALDRMAPDCAGQDK